MAAAIFLDTVSRLPGTAGEGNDAVSAFSQVHTSEAVRVLRLSGKGAPTSVDKTTAQSKTETRGLDRRTSDSP